MSVLIVLATGLSLCAKQGVYFVQEMGDLELTHKRVSLTQLISSLVFICLKRTLGLTKKERRM